MRVRRVVESKVYVKPLLMIIDDRRKLMHAEYRKVLWVVGIRKETSPGKIQAARQNQSLPTFLPYAVQIHAMVPQAATGPIAP